MFINDNLICHIIDYPKLNYISKTPKNIQSIILADGKKINNNVEQNDNLKVYKHGHVGNADGFVFFSDDCFRLKSQGLLNFLKIHNRIIHSQMQDIYFEYSQYRISLRK